jgi:hypothetical protein
MRLIIKADLQARTNRELDGMKEEIRKDLGCIEQRRRQDYAALADIRRVQRQRKIMRPNL